jgi:uncharacterized membrane protein YraQ (UPF0718 family)
MTAVLIKSGEALLSLAPYVLLGVLSGEILKLTSWTRLIGSMVAKAPLISIFFAAGLGIVSPLCTYGTIPMVIQLCNAGIHIAPLVTFLTASSLMNPQLFIMTWGGLGPEMALVRVGTVFLFGILLGLLIYRLPKVWALNPNLFAGSKEEGQEGAGAGLSFSPGTFPAGNVPPSPHPFTWGNFIRKNLATLQYVGFYMLVGIVSGAVIEVYMPGQWIAFLFRGNRWMSIFLAALLGVPLYACGGGAIPLVASLLREGMSKGAALAFFIVGPATRPTPLMALATILRPLFIAAYVILLILFAIISGGIYK